MSRSHCLVPDACAAKSEKTHCRRCSALKANSDPDATVRRVAGLKAKFEDPVYLAEHRERTRQINERAKHDPDLMESRRESGRRAFREVLSRPDVRARTYSPEANALRGRASRATKLAWCPPEYRDEYIRLMRSKLMKAVDARRMIEEQIAVDHKRYLVTGELQQTRRAA